MRRLSYLPVAGVLLAGLGCQHIAGKCDLGGHPADAAPPAVTNPYAAAPVPVTAPAPPPAAKDAPAKLQSGN